LIHDIFLLAFLLVMTILCYILTRPQRKQIKIPGLKPFYCSRCGQIIQVDEPIFEGGRCWQCHTVMKKIGRMG
jgi:hypothetical protein